MKKTIASLPTLQKRLEELKAKHRKVKDQKAQELREIQQLVETFNAKALNAEGVTVENASKNQKPT